VIVEKSETTGTLTLALDRSDRHALVMAVERMIAAFYGRPDRARHRDRLAYYEMLTCVLDVADDPPTPEPAREH